MEDKKYYNVINIKDGETLNFDLGFLLPKGAEKDSLYLIANDSFVTDEETVVVKLF